MEDALRESAQNLIGKVFTVLILVLMEDALRVVTAGQVNGACTPS